MKSQLLCSVENLLKKYGFKYLITQGCFDIFAKKKKEKYVLKILFNIDAFSNEYARNLALISDSLKASPFIIGKCTRYEWLDDCIVYQRFGIPAVTINTFLLILKNSFPLIKRYRRGLFVKVSSKKLKNARRKSNISQSQLAKLIGVSKKCIYEHERNDKFMFYEIAKLLEDVLKTKITLEPDFNLHAFSKKPKKKIERIVFEHFIQMRFQTTYVEKAPFNIMASKKTTILSYSSEHCDENKKEILKHIARIEKWFPLIITTKGIENEDIPHLYFKDFVKMDAQKFTRFINVHELNR